MKRPTSPPGLGGSVCQIPLNNLDCLTSVPMEQISGIA